ncbi:hypothetical protein PCANC_18183 [Puccinia coronata f. sp. avenae]|uniref:Uncharacterized protein n=1 Tax=Puccinia coronata f. sp. avenae TaxID=200324 RepID=A0A2N5SNM0_9BASI|nr:hypothetical protein PCANC_18183 [Puccinia coronata f. sp. avenae]
MQKWRELASIKIGVDSHEAVQQGTALRAELDRRMDVELALNRNQPPSFENMWSTLSAAEDPARQMMMSEHPNMGTTVAHGGVLYQAFYPVLVPIGIAIYPVLVPTGVSAYPPHDDEQLGRVNGHPNSTPPGATAQPQGSTYLPRRKPTSAGRYIVPADQGRLLLGGPAKIVPAKCSSLAGGCRLYLPAEEDSSLTEL